MGQQEDLSSRERRKYLRLATSVEVKYKIIGDPGEVKVFSRDISAGGLCILAQEKLAPNTPLELKIKIPDLVDHIRALGKVVWQKKSESSQNFDTGLEFTGISDFDRFNINRYIMERIEIEE